MKKISLLLAFLLLLSCFSTLNAFDVKAEAPAVVLRNDEIIEFEAEGEYANIMHHYQIGTDEPEASGEGYVYVPRNIGLISTAVWPTDTPAHIYYNLDVQEEGIYYLWVRIKSMDSGADSNFMCFDSAPPSYNEFLNYGDWSWYMVSMENLSLGNHKLNVLYRELNNKLDKIVLTTIPDFSPSGNKYSTPEFLPAFGDDTELEYPLPAITPPKDVHPRLLLTKKDIPEIKKNLNHPQNKDVYDMLLKEAEMDCDGIFPPMAASAYTNVVGTDLACGESNAFLYLMTGEKQYADKAINIALNAMRTMNNRKGNDTVTRTGGNCIFACSKIYDWCYDVMTDEQRAEMRAYMYLHISLTEVGWPANEQGDYNTHAQEGILWVDLLAAGIATYDEDPKLYNMVAGRVLTTMVPIKNKWYNTPYQGEGANYGPMRFQFEIMCAFLFRGMGYDDVFHPYQQYQRYGSFWLRRPDGRMIKTGDDANEELYGYFSGYNPSLFSSANYYKDPYLKRQYYKENQKGIVSGSSQGAITCAMFLIMNDVSVEPDATYRDFSLTMFGGYPQNRMTARTSWDEGVNTDTLLVSMNVIGNMLPGHQHVDAGHFDIFYKGSLAIDSGIYESASYVGEDGKLVTSSLQLAAGSPHEKTYHKATVAHNCMLVYDPDETYEDSKILRVDGGQKRWYQPIQIMTIDDAFSDSHEVGKLISYDYGPDIKEPAYSYLKGNLTDAYTDKVKHYTRSFMFLNFFDKEYPGALIVMDNVESSNPSFKKSWLLHSQEEPEVSGNETIIRRTELGSNGKLLNTTLLPKEHTITKIGGPGHEFDVNGVNFYAKPKTKVQEAGNWRIEVSPEKASNQDYFLNVMQITENNNAPEPLKVELIENDSRYAGVEIKDRVVYLRKDDLISTRDLKVQSKSESGSFMYIIDGLKEGSWKIYDKNGKLISTQLCYTGNNTISFEAEAGEYTLKWKYSKNGEKDFINEDREMEENPLDVKINLVYETFKTAYNDGDDVYFAIEEFLPKQEDAYKFENNIITFENGITIDLNNKTYKTAKEPEQKIEKFIEKNGEHYTTFEEFSKIMGYSYYRNPISNIVFVTTPESSIDKYMFENSTDPDRIAVKKVTACAETTASQYQTLDDNEATFWSAAGKGCWVIYEFEKPEIINAIDLYWASGDSRVEDYELWLSEDGENYENVFNGKSSGKILGFERHNLTSNKKYKFVKLIGNENSNNSWNSLAEIRFFKPVN